MTGKFNYTRNFKISFENKCIRLFVEAYNQYITEKSIQVNWEENDITSQLHEYIDKNPLRSKWSISSNVEQHLPNHSVAKTKGFAAKDLRIDLRFVKFQMKIFQSSKQHEVFFEAKRLKASDSGLKRRYIDTGIDNFTTLNYPHGFLVGYLLEGTVSSTIENGINKLLRDDSREQECLHPQQHEIVQHYFESNHSDLCLKHLIFDFTGL